ncbi:MAG TPA: hypothetical protein VKT32_10985 [Chthonomonadaceae bacterium]|nr:hypothetical protein [Chthonomonadaceae bacterium]
MNHGIRRRDRPWFTPGFMPVCLLWMQTATLLILLTAMAAAEQSPIVRAANLIRAHQAGDGAIAQDALPAGATRILPYFANFAALGLVTAYRHTGDPDYLESARRWAGWYAAHQNPDGTVYDYTGAPGAWKPTGDYDSTDSYAATYLTLLLALYRASPDPKWLAGRRDSIEKAVKAIKLTLQPIGLTLAKPTYPVMYTMDNVETAQGLHAAAEIARLLHLAPLREETEPLARRMETAVAHDLWDPATESYLIGLQPDGYHARGFKVWYPDVMANLMAIAWLPESERNRALFARMKTLFADTLPEQVAGEQDLEHLDWWGWAAWGAHDTALLKQIQQRLATFDRVQHAFYPATLGHLCRLMSFDLHH